MRTGNDVYTGEKIIKKHTKVGHTQKNIVHLSNVKTDNDNLTCNQFT